MVQDRAPHTNHQAQRPRRDTERERFRERGECRLLPTQCTTHSRQPLFCVCVRAPSARYQHRHRHRGLVPAAAETMTVRRSLGSAAGCCWRAGKKTHTRQHEVFKTSSSSSNTLAHTQHLFRHTTFTTNHTLAHIHTPLAPPALSRVVYVPHPTSTYARGRPTQPHLPTPSLFLFAALCCALSA